MSRAHQLLADYPVLEVDQRVIVPLVHFDKSRVDFELHILFVSNVREAINALLSVQHQHVDLILRCEQRRRKQYY